MKYYNREHKISRFPQEGVNVLKRYTEEGVWHFVPATLFKEMFEKSKQKNSKDLILNLIVNGDWESNMLGWAILGEEELLDNTAWFENGGFYLMEQDYNKK